VEQPFISVIIATRGRRAQLRQCLVSLAGQTYRRERWEVIVVEDGDEEPPDQGVAALRQRLPLEYLQQPHAGCGMARNSGAAQSRGRYLVFTDDDCRFPGDWLCRYEDQFQRTAGCLVAGRSINALKGNPYSQATQELVDYLLSKFNASAEQATFGAGNNMGVPAEEFRELGGFSPRYFRSTAEDRDLCARWVEAGRRLVYAPDIVVHHAHRLSFGSFLKQHFHYGRGAYLFHRLEAERRRSRVKLESASFYCALLLWPWSKGGGPQAARRSLLLLVSQVAHTAGYLRGFLASHPPGDGGANHLEQESRNDYGGKWICWADPAIRLEPAGL
jgi:glycosyltransferase involved in cell wall biosynthesis